MSLPPITKSYVLTKRNQVLAATGTLLTDQQNLMLAMKRSFCEVAGVPATIIASCNGAGGAGSFDNAGVDKWGTTNTNLVWAANGVNHSWIVLQFSGILATFQVCIDLTSTPNNAVISFSPTGVFTGGNATNAPTAADESFLLGTSHAASAAWLSNAGADFSAVLNVIPSTDGQVWNFWINIANVTVSMGRFSKPANVVTGSPGWTNPSWGLYYTNATNVGQFADLCATASPKAKGRANGVTMSLWLTSEGWNSSVFPAGQRLLAPSDLTGEYPLSPIGLASETVSAKGRHGTAVDLWWGSVTANNGDAYPHTDVTRILIHVGNLAVPWGGDGLVPLLA